MKCKHCGEEIANDSRFCEFCGTKIKKRGLPWWAILLIVIGAVFTIFGFVGIIETLDNNEYVPYEECDTIMEGVEPETEEAPAEAEEVVAYY